jgi:hypothetical protein
VLPQELQQEIERSLINVKADLLVAYQSVAHRCHFCREYDGRNFGNLRYLSLIHTRQ